MSKCIIQKLDFLVIPQSASKSVCKYYLDFLLDLKCQPYILQVNKMCLILQIILKERNYESVINIIGGFHILLIKRKILFNKCNLLCMPQWC